MYHLSQFARATPDKVAVHFLESGKAFTFAQLERQANRAANALLSLGLKQHDCIALCLENSPELVFLTLAAQRIGLYYTLMSTRLSAAPKAAFRSSPASTRSASSSASPAATRPS